ncbi:hypothetical protein ABEB36_009107 [Hypothenemus hampei]|uniref:DAN domain-containing protein n=1 Tax=Hypothenemus hampei TaxID=57062 RepID=A0ABD1EP75_HYPHA
MLVYYFLFWLILFSNGGLSDTDLDWQKPGCHLVGHKQTINLRGCISFDITLNACRGYCESYALPSDPRNTQITQPVTSVGTCCNIMESESYEARVLCVDEVRHLVFKSAVTCACYHCKKD